MNGSDVRYVTRPSPTYARRGTPALTARIPNGDPVTWIECTRCGMSNNASTPTIAIMRSGRARIARHQHDPPAWPRLMLELGDEHRDPAEHTGHRRQVAQELGAAQHDRVRASDHRCRPRPGAGGERRMADGMDGHDREH